MQHRIASLRMVPAILRELHCGPAIKSHSTRVEGGSAALLLQIMFYEACLLQAAGAVWALSDLSSSRQPTNPCGLFSHFGRQGCDGAACQNSGAGLPELCCACKLVSGVCLTCKMHDRVEASAQFI